MHEITGTIKYPGMKRLKLIFWRKVCGKIFFPHIIFYDNPVIINLILTKKY